MLKMELNYMNKSNYMSPKDIQHLKYKQVCTTKNSDVTGLKCAHWNKSGIYSSKDCQNCKYAIYENGALIKDKRNICPIYCSHPANRKK